MSPVKTACLTCPRTFPKDGRHARCPTCRAPHDRARERRKQAARGPRHNTTRAWRKLRAVILARDGHRCTYRDADGHRCPRTADLTVDHVRARIDGGTDDPSNLRTLCRSHNSQLGAKVGNARRK